MPRFFFHVFDDAVSIDEDGQLAEDLEGARAIALNGARELLHQPSASKGVLDGFLDSRLGLA